MKSSDISALQACISQAASSTISHPFSSSTTFFFSLCWAFEQTPLSYWIFLFNHFLALYTPSWRLNGLTALIGQSCCWHSGKQTRQKCMSIKFSKYWSDRLESVCFVPKRNNNFSMSSYLLGLFTRTTVVRGLFAGRQLPAISPVVASFFFLLHSRHWTWAFINRPALFLQLNNPAWDLSSTSLSFSLSLYLTLSLALHPSLPVWSCPPSHLSCDVYGPFCFCVLMTTVTESYPLPMRPDERCYPDTLLTPSCPWP